MPHKPLKTGFKNLMMKVYKLLKPMECIANNWNLKMQQLNATDLKVYTKRK